MNLGDPHSEIDWWQIKENIKGFLITVFILFGLPALLSYCTYLAFPTP